MQVIIFEGIATSGKTKTIEEFKKLLGSNYEVIYENKTLMKILDNKDESIALGHLNSLKEKIQSIKSDILIIDRFHYTHIFRSNSTFNYFGELETWLAQFDTTVVILKISFDEIMNRINLGLSHRSQAWCDYVNKKGSPEQIRNYYFEQQVKLFEISAGSKLPNLSINTDTQSWNKYAEMVLKSCKIN